ncbi:hypothetical protein [Knoellia sp. LjRoot47]|uniref:hypothetical protein n=1 Tax=Knoellia sp. LjRoot47 TaxID=3342330 RepID=UPI003ECCB0F4
MLWLPKCLAKGRGSASNSPRLTGPDIVLYAHYRDATDNKSNVHTINRVRAARRTGADERTVLRRTDHLAAAGLLTVTMRSEKGAPKVVRVHPVPARSRFDIPVALLWEIDDPQCPPRWGRSDTGAAMRSLLAILNFTDHGRDGQVGRTPDLRATVIAKAARLSTSDYRLGLEVILGPGLSRGDAREDYWGRSAPGGWMRSEPRTVQAEDGTWRQAPNRITISWDALPTQVIGHRASLRDLLADGLSGPVQVTNAGVGQVTNPGVGQLTNPGWVVPGTSNTQERSKPKDASPRVRAYAPGTTQPTQAHDEEADRVIDLDIIRAAVTLDRDDVSDRLMTEMYSAGSETSLNDDAWMALVIANARHIPDAHARIPLTFSDAGRLRSRLLKARQSGWTAHGLAAALTADTMAGALSLYAVTSARLSAAMTNGAVPTNRERPGAVWMAPAPTPITRKAAHERAVFEAQEARRDPAYYAHAW